MKNEEIKKFFEAINLQKDFQTKWEHRLQKRRQIEHQFKNFTGKLWVFGDLHIPYTLWDVIFKKILPEIEKDKAKKKMIVLPGDTFNFDLWSHFRKESGFTSLPSHEIELGQKFLTILSKIADFVLQILSNHDMRMIKFIQDAIKGVKEQEELAKFIKSFDELFDIPGVQIIDDWLVQIGDVIIPHGGPTSRAVKGRTGTWAIDAFCGALRHLVRKDWVLIMQPHGHLQSSIRYRDKKSIEVGCLCKPLDYQFLGTKSYSYGKYGDWHRGYGICEMVNGKADINSATYIQVD